MRYLFHLLVYLDVYIIVALGLNLPLGYCGLLTLSHAAYFAIGAYTYALATISLDCGFLSASAMAVVVAAVLSLALSLPATRVKGDYFVLLSLAVQALIFGLSTNWFSPDSAPGTWDNLTNGSLGLAGIPKPIIVGWRLKTDTDMAALATLFALACVFIIRLLAFSPWGRLLQAIRDDELAARGLGKNVRLAKVQCLAISCGIIALAGALFSAYVRYVDPNIASLDQSILMLCMVLVGGSGNLRGPIIGAAILLAVPEILRFVNVPSAMAPNVRLILYGVLIVVMMHLRPQGLAGVYRVD